MYETEPLRAAFCHILDERTRLHLPVKYSFSARYIWPVSHISTNFNVHGATIHSVPSDRLEKHSRRQRFTHSNRLRLNVTKTKSSFIFSIYIMVYPKKKISVSAQKRPKASRRPVMSTCLSTEANCNTMACAGQSSS